MVVPLIGRSAAAVVGALLVLTAWYSAVGTLIVPRSVSSWLTVWVDRIVHGTFRLVARAIADYKRRDRVLAGEAATILLAQLAAWLATSFVGFWLLLWPFEAGGAPSAIVTAAGATGLVIVTLQIAYLPSLYAAFNRRETEVALLNARAGVPSWGPELLARTHYALGSGVSTVDTLPDLYARWEVWAADVAESHSTYLPLVRFRSPRPLSSWVTALLAVLDSAALYLALSPKAAPTVPARLCLRAGFQCFNQIATAMGIQVPGEASPPSAISLTYEEFLSGIDRMRKIDFPLERDPAEAWPDFVGWRANYEHAAYAVAADIYAVPALWSGPRRPPIPAIPPYRPPLGRPPK